MCCLSNSFGQTISENLHRRTEFFPGKSNGLLVRAQKCVIPAYYYYTTTTVKAIIHLDSHCLFFYYYSTDTKIGLVLAHFLIFHNLEPSDMNNKKLTGSYKYDDEVALFTVRLNSSRLSKLRCVLFLCARILHDARYFFCKDMTNMPTFSSFTFHSTNFLCLDSTT